MLPIHPSAVEDSVSFEDIELHVVVHVKSPEQFNQQQVCAQNFSLLCELLLNFVVAPCGFDLSYTLFDLSIFEAVLFIYDV